MNAINANHYRGIEIGWISVLVPISILVLRMFVAKFLTMVKGERSVVMAGNSHMKSGDKFQLSDMPANCVDIHNVCGIIGDDGEAFNLEYANKILLRS